MGLLSMALGGLLPAQGGDAAFGLLPMLAQQQGGGTPPPAAPMGGMNAAFSGDPQFQQQLQALMQNQGPGMQAPQFTPPAFQMSANAAATRPQGGAVSPHDRRQWPFGLASTLR